MKMRIRPTALILVWGVLVLGFFTPPGKIGGVQAAANSLPDQTTMVPRLMARLEQKVFDLRALDADNPGKGFDRIARELKARLESLKASDFTTTSISFGDSPAYVVIGGRVHLTPEFAHERYNDTERMAILLHESIHLDQGLWDRKIAFLGDRGEKIAHLEEYKWLRILGADPKRFETINVVDELVRYKVIASDQELEALDRKSGITPEMIKILGLSSPSDQAEQAAVLKHSNTYYFFKVPAGWEVEFGQPGTPRQLDVFITKVVEAFKYDDGTVGASFGVRLSLTPVLGVPNGLSADKVRDDQMRQDKKFDFSGGKDQRTFSTFDRKIAGQPAFGYIKRVTSVADDQTTTEKVNEHLYFEKDQRYYTVEFSYNKRYHDAVYGGYWIFLFSLQVK